MSNDLLLANFVIVLSITGLTSLFLGLFVLIKGPKTINKIFALYSFSISLWSFLQIMLITADNKQSAFMWARIATAEVVFIPTFFLHFIISFLRVERRKWLLYFAYFFSFIIITLCPTKYMVVDVVPKFYLKYFPIATMWYHFFTSFYMVFILCGLLILFSEYRKSFGEARNRLEYLWWSSLFGYIGGSASFFLSYGINIPILIPFGTYAVPVYVVITTYAILRHQLMDINIVIRKTAIYSILVTIVTLVYFILIYIIEGLFRGFLGYKSVPWTLSVIAIFALIFQPLKNLIQFFIDRYFFKGSLLHEYEKAQEELKRSERLKAVGTLAAGMAHEIKNPLTGIKTFTEYLPSKRNDPEFLDKFYKIVSVEVNKINDIVQQLLDFSKPKPLQLKPYDVHTLLDQTISFLSNDFIKSNINVNKNYAPALPMLNIDHNQIQQVFLNLFLNSIDAMKQGGMLTISTSLQSTTATITIQDTGTGISKKDLEHIFDPFYSTKEKGTGLGMSIVYGIIKEHKGEISVASEVNKGTMFKVKLMTI